MSSAENAPDSPATRPRPARATHSQQPRAGGRRRAIKAAAVSTADAHVRGADGMALADGDDPKVINIAREHPEGCVL